MPAEPIRVLVAGSDGVVLQEFLLGEGTHHIGAAATSAIPIAAAADEHIEPERASTIVLAPLGLPTQRHGPVLRRGGPAECVCGLADIDHAFVLLRGVWKKFGKMFENIFFNILSILASYRNRTEKGGKF